MFHPSSWCRPARRSAVLLGLVGSLTLASSLSGAAARQTYNLPADAAERSLRAFSARSGVQVIFPTELTAGVRTAPVQGEFTPSEALERMLAGTNLTAVLDQKTGNITLRRTSDSAGAKKQADSAETASAATRSASASARAAERTQDYVVQLSEFVINAEASQGYFTANTISGTRIAEQIKNLPLNVSVLTAEFLRDAAIYDVDSILQWTASNTGPNNPRIRGLQSNTRVNGFEGSERDDAISIGRVEVIKGPGAIISGSGAPGGIVNVLTKRPTRANRLRTAQVFNDRGFSRTELDLDYKLNEQLSARVAAARVSEKGFSSQRVKQEWDDYKKTEYTWFGVVEWRPTRKLTITGDITYLTQDRPFRDQPGVRWDNYGTIAPAAGQPAVYLIEPPFNYPKSFGLSGPDAIDDIHNTLFNVEAVQQFTDDLQLRVVANGKRRSRLIFGPAFTGLVTANAALVAQNPAQNLVAGERYLSTRWDWSEQVNPQSYNYEFNLLWKSRLGEVLENKVLFGGNYGEGSGWSQNGRSRLPGSTTEQRYFYRLGDTAPNVRRPADLNMVFDPHSALNSTEQRNAFLVHQGKWQGGKWHTMLGLFYYDFANEQFTNNLPVVAKQDGMNPQIGAVRQLNDWLSAYAIYAKSIQGQSRRNSRGEVLPPFKGTNYEAGLKLETADNRYSGTISVFHTDFVGRQFNDPTVPDITGSINPGELVSSGEDRSRGLDTEFVFTPVPRWQVVLGYAYLDTEVVKDVSNRPERIGQRFNNHSFHNYSLWTRYNFGTNELLRGFSVGGGIRGDSGAIRQYVTIAGVPVAAEDTTDPYVELFLGYERRIGCGRLMTTLNLKNLTRTDRYSSQFRAGTNQPYFVWRDPVEPFLRVAFEY
jgi:iron complex outermembrane receptor protein